MESIGCGDAIHYVDISGEAKVSIIKDNLASNKIRVYRPSYGDIIIADEKIFMTILFNKEIEKEYNLKYKKINSGTYAIQFKSKDDFSKFNNNSIWSNVPT